MRTMIVLRGLPGSGKSTEAAAIVASDPKRWLRINRDDMRVMAVGHGNDPYNSPGREAREKVLRDAKDELVRLALNAGYDVVLDDTHLVPQTLKRLHELAASVGDVTLVEKGINVPIEECIRRDSLRPKPHCVGEKVIRDMARAAGIDKGRQLNDKETHYPTRWDGKSQTESLGYDPSSTLPKAVICDLDGTLALMNGRNPYDASACDKDLPNMPVIEAIKALYSQGYAVLFTSGRMDKYREPTVKFIERWVRVPHHGMDDVAVATGDKVIDYCLFMRATGDQRKDNVIKRELFNAHIRGRYNVVFALDDRDQVVDNWRQMGIACFQVNYGSF